MNNNKNNKSHARRRPDGISYQNVNSHISNRNSYRDAERKSKTAYSAEQTQKVVRANSYNTKIIQSGKPRTSARQSLAVTSSEREVMKQEKRLIKQEQRLVKAEYRESEWQRDIVRVRGGMDKFMLSIILVLLLLGSMTVFSSSYPYAIKEGLDSYTFIVDQIKYIFIGIIGLLCTFFFPMKWYKSWVAPIAYSVSAVLLVVVLFIGTKEGVTSRWIDLGPINIQPSELMKVSLILMVAWYAERFNDKMRDLNRGTVSLWWNTLIPDAIVGVACVLVLIGKHLSGTIIVGAIGIALLVISGCRILWLIETILPVGVVAIALFLVNNEYALERITSFRNENADKLDELYQTTQSIYAIGSGGLFGVGLGGSRQKYSYLGAAHTDFIFSIWCEEWGFIGAVALIVLFVLFIWRGYVIALRAPDKFTMLVAFGITTHVGLQAFLNMCVASDIIMNTGITLPFFSYGGSALVIVMAEMGILLKISQQYYRKKSDIEHDELARKAGLL